MCYFAFPPAQPPQLSKNDLSWGPSRREKLVHFSLQGLSKAGKEIFWTLLASPGGHRGGSKIRVVIQGLDRGVQGAMSSQILEPFWSYFGAFWGQFWSYFLQPVGHMCLNILVVRALSVSSLFPRLPWLSCYHSVSDSQGRRVPALALTISSWSATTGPEILKMCPTVGPILNCVAKVSKVWPKTLKNLVQKTKVQNLPKHLQNVPNKKISKQKEN